MMNIDMYVIDIFHWAGRQIYRWTLSGPSTPSGKTEKMLDQIIGELNETVFLIFHLT